MTIFEGHSEIHSNFDDKAKAIGDMEDIRARRGNGHSIIGKVKYKKRSRAPPPCHSCKITDSPERRRGPNGQRTLCNACGHVYAKLVRKRDRIINSGGDRPPPIDIAFLRKFACIVTESSAPARSSAGRRRSRTSKDKSKAKIEAKQTLPALSKRR